MRAKAQFVLNSEEIQRAIDMNLNVPKEEYIERDLYFSSDYLESAYLSPHSNDIVIHLVSSGRWILEYSEVLWNKIKLILEEK